MKKLLLFVSALLAAAPLFAQDTLFGTPPKKLDWGVQFGTSATFAGKYGSSFNTSVSPHLTWQPSQRFRINAGISIVNTSLFGYTPYYYGYGLENGKSFSGNYTHALLYAEGQYLLTKDLQLSGSIYAEVPLTGSDPNNPYSTSNFKGASMNLQYRIGPHATIQAGFNYIRSEGPFRYDPFMNSGTMFYDPFGTRYSDPFSH